MSVRTLVPDSCTPRRPLKKNYVAIQLSSPGSAVRTGMCSGHPNIWAEWSVMWLEPRDPSLTQQWELRGAPRSWKETQYAEP